MARRPDDATRFTATGPYIESKPAGSTGPSFASNGPPNVAPAPSSSAGSQIKFGQAPPGETAQQKIARLRAAAALAKRGQESSFDKTVRIGRVWADRAHRVTAIGLISLTVVAGVVATAGITDMLMHNRRRRNEWLAEQQRKTAISLQEAKQAAGLGQATEDQMLLINRERAAAVAAEEKKNRPGMFKRASNYLFGGLEKEEQKGGRLGAGGVTASATAAVQDKVQTAKDELLGENEDKGVLAAVEEKVDGQRRQGEKIVETVKPMGGYLDRQAQYVADDVSNRTKSWTGWITGR